VAAMIVNGSGQTIFVSDWLISKKSSPLKPLCQMNRNWVGSIYGRSSIKIAHFIPICYQTWPPHYQILIHLAKWLQRSSEKIFLEINQSETRIVCGGHV
jgi:hypothetical protein